jgi:proline iminopeptidase
MKLFVFILCLFLFSINAFSVELYISTFGNPKDKPIIFLHGGPGYNCANFEATTAKELSKSGFFVVCYDRRGEGRSLDTSAKFTFQQTSEDLISIYKKYGLTKATLIGHSFGGIVAIKFSEMNPKLVNSVILVGAPVSLQETFTNIIAKSKDIYTSKNDTVSLKYIALLENMDKSSLAYMSYTFGNAMNNNFYSPKIMTDEAKSIYSLFKTDSILIKYSAKMTYPAPTGFWKNENYTMLDLNNNLIEIVINIPVYGLYGKDDGLYSTEQVEKLQKIIGDKNLHYFDNCSHNVFIDQQKLFIQSIVNWTK